MKILASLFLFIATITALPAQSDKPVLGQDYKVVYNPSQTGNFKDAKKLSVVYVYNYWGKRVGTRLALRANVLHPDSSRVRREEMFHSGLIWSSTITIPPNAAVLSYYITDGKTIDMNNDKTYTSYIYTGDGKPSQNAHYFMVPFLKMSGASIEEMIEESKEEILVYPENFRAYYQYFQLRLDWKRGSTGMQEMIANELAALGRTYADNTEYLNLAARTYYYLFRDTKAGLQYRNKIPADKQYPDVVMMYDRDELNQKKEQIERETSVVREALIDNPAPAFQLHQHGGGTASLGEHKGKVILLNFWTTTIQPCKDMLPQLQKLFEKFPSDRFAMFGINMDQTVNVIKPFIEQLQLSFPVLISDNKVTKDYGVGAVPQTVLINKKGIVKKIYVGYAAGDEKELNKEVEAYIRDQE